MSRRVVLWIVVGAIPWTWFLLRDHLGQLGDLLALGLPALAVPCVGTLAVGRIWARWRVVVAWMASWALVFALAVFGPRLPAPMGEPLDPITLVTANVRFDNPQTQLAAADVLAQDADVVVVPEATQYMMRELTPSYDYEELTVPGERAYDVAVLSRFPLRDAELLELGNGVLRVEVDAPEPFVLYAAHLSRPVIAPRQSSHVSHAENLRQVRALDERIERETMPVVVAGDLNLSDRVRGYRELTDDLVDVTRDGWAATTYVGGLYRFFLLRIDHVLASEDWCGEGADDFDITGSDHRGVRVDIGACG
jgi:endonuclease/exonuclease/phosphatase (EEP) superfamily protein YafD